MPRKPSKSKASPPHLSSTPKSSTSPKSPKLAKSDLKALSAICDSTTFDEISFDSWEQAHDALDLTIPLRLVADAAREGGERVVLFTRTITATPGTAPELQKASCTVAVPAGVQDGTRLLVKGQGDIRQTTAGDLIVIVHVKA